MKKLQNNFTTPEQSKRLLELGVPAWTADLYFYEQGRINNNDEPSGVTPYNDVYKDNSAEIMFARYVSLPCWSVGRLIEILEIILGSPWSDHEELGKSTLAERVLRDFEDVVKYKEIFKDNRIDFSKLEE